jgi:hypothetical protein
VFRTVGEIKSDLITTFSNIAEGIGSPVVFPYEVVGHFNEDDYQFTHGASYTAIKISGGYSGTTYG